MAITTINVGTNPNDGTGDSLRTSFTICNNNFSYLESIISGNGIVSANSLIISGNVLLGESLSFTPPGAALQYGGTANSYVQMVIQNKSSLTNASSDYVATADNGDDANYFIDMGIASSTYYYAGYDAILPNDGYLIVNGGNLLLNPGTPNGSVKFVVGGSEVPDIVGQISNTAVTFNHTTISTSTTSGALQLAGGAGIAGNVFVGSALNAEGGAVISGTFSGAYTSGIILDNESGNGRVSLGANTGLIVYNNGLADTRLLAISNAGDVSITSNTPATTTTSGALVVTGGLGVGGNVHIGGNIALLHGNAAISGPGLSLIPTALSLANIRTMSYAGSTLLGTNTTAISANISPGFASKVALDVNANITITYNTISPGYEKTFFIRNVDSVATANIILPNANNNKGSTVVPVGPSVTATVNMIAADSTAANVMVTIINN